MRRTVLAALLALVMLIGLLPGVAAADGDAGNPYIFPPANWQSDPDSASMSSIGSTKHTTSVHMVAVAVAGAQLLDELVGEGWRKSWSGPTCHNSLGGGWVENDYCDLQTAGGLPTQWTAPANPLGTVTRAQMAGFLRRLIDISNANDAIRS